MRNFINVFLKQHKLTKNACNILLQLIFIMNMSSSTSNYAECMADAEYKQYRAFLR